MVASRSGRGRAPLPRSILRRRRYKGRERRAPRSRRLRSRDQRGRASLRVVARRSKRADPKPRPVQRRLFETRHW